MISFCDKHMETLHRTVNAAGLGDFNNPDPKLNLKLTLDLLMEKPITKSEFNPVVWCQMMIAERALRMADTLGISPETFAVAGMFNPELACPICHLNSLIKQHMEVCDNPECPIGTGEGQHQDVNFWIPMAVDGAKLRLKQLKD